MTEEKEKNPVNLSNDFQRELAKKKHKTNWLGIISAFFVSIVVVVIVGVGSYQIFFKPEKNEISSNDKIESKPSEDKNISKTEVKPDSTIQTTPTPTQTTGEEYTIVDGDNLGEIAAKFSTTVEKLKAANNIQDETSLQIGQKIKIVK